MDKTKTRREQHKDKTLELFEGDVFFFRRRLDKSKDKSKIRQKTRPDTDTDIDKARQDKTRHNKTRHNKTNTRQDKHKTRQTQDKTNTRQDKHKTRQTQDKTRQEKHKTNTRQDKTKTKTWNMSSTQFSRDFSSSIRVPRLFCGRDGSPMRWVGVRVKS